ncbi:MAG TPA: phenylalanine--tRNA ligase beta subunit-related protein [Streptosporangiaceae bacterium]|nr:phenylalanine--tRNA ligase beta subunit-related protein [Streptosporangiaceae bacterium]
MAVLRVSEAVCQGFPRLRIAAIVARGFGGNAPWPEVDAGLAALEKAAADGARLPAGEEEPHIAAWYAAYRAFGTNPKRERPSVDALRRRLARTGRLPRINAAVDCYNLVSVSHGVPAGAFDLDATHGDIAVGFAAGSERFTPLGEPGTTEHPRPGEVIYADQTAVLTRHWNHRDADRTKVTEHSSNILFLLETTESAAFGPVVAAAAADLSARVATRSGQVSTQWLTPASPAAVLGDPGT